MPRYGLIAAVVFLLFWCGTEFICGLHNVSKTALKARVKEMFLHAYYNYKNNAFPADELMPLSCKGRYRWEGVTRGDIDDALGNFSLTMLDGLDSLFLIGELDEFDSAVKAVVETVKFDSDVDVSVFETNIRVLGGLLGAHVAALAIKENNSSRMIWYKDELLKMAIDIGNRLLPAFDTPTGIPYPRINLRYGSSGLKKQEENTCTACAGTMILEFAALSRLTGDPIYEEKAAKAMAFLWKQRNRYSDLVGRVINVRNGDWIRQESGVGAGIDSYYEYLLKAYILLGEPVYLHRFQTHYEAVNRYVGGPQSAEFPFLFLDVHMHRPAQRARTFMDALLAFWPGLQVLTGDVKRAVALHELLYLIHKRNKLLPEAFTPDFNVHWGQHLLRPELIESTYLLYRATEDPYYLQVGQQIVNDLEKYTRVPCGFAAIKDVRTMEHEDQFDSFVLAETFKYLYLLFAESSDLPINLDDYIFTTEAHLLPLSLSRHPVTSSSLNRIVKNISQNASIPVSSSSSSYLSASMSSSSTVKLTPDHHGDRDVKVEKLLHKAAQCMAVGYEQMQHRHTMKCLSSSRNKNNQEAEKSEDDNKKKNNEAEDGGDDKVKNKEKDSGATTTTVSDADWRLKTTCHISETPNLFYHYCAKQLPKCHNTDDFVLKYVFSKSHVWRIIDSIRQPLRQIAINLDHHQSRSGHTSTTTTNNNNNHNMKDQSFLPLKAMDFQPDNTDHLNALRRMGISLSFSQDGQITLTHQHNMAEDSDLAAAGILFIQELIALTNRKYSFSDLSVQGRHVVVMNSPSYGFTKFTACPAHFGLFPGEKLPSSQQDSQNRQQSTPSAAEAEKASSVNSTWTPLIGPVHVVEPIDACKPIAEYGYAYPPENDIWNQNPTGGQQNTSIHSSDSYITVKNSKGPMVGSIGIVRRGGCVFVEKAYHLAQAGAIGVIVVDNKPETSSEIGPLFAMSGDNDNNDLMKYIHIPVVLLLGVERDQLFSIIRTHWNHTQEAMNIMLTKEYNLADSFNAALSIMNTKSNGEHEKLPLNNDNSNIVGDTNTSFQLTSHLYQSSSVSMKTLHLNKISDIIGFSISYDNNNTNSDMFHLRDSVSPSSSSPSSNSPSSSSSSTSESPGSSVGSDSETVEEDVTRIGTTPSDSIYPLSWSFTFSINDDKERSSYFLPINENNDHLFVGDDNNNSNNKNNTVIKGSPKDISIWRDLFNNTLKQIKLNTECQHFMLAVLQISLHKVCPSDSPYYMNQTIYISWRYYQLINTCLSELLHLNEKSIKQQEETQPSDKNNQGTTTNNNNNNPDNIVITLQLGFQLISNNDDLSSTTILSPTSSSSPPSHPAAAADDDEAGVSQTTTSAPTPTPKDEL